MGITGLLPYLKKASHPANIKEYKGCTVAIDSYCWLHKGAFSCAEKLATGEKTDQYVYYCMKFVNMLLANGIKPLMVFDGNRLPSKAEVEKARRERRDMFRKKAAQLLREGKRTEARDCLTKCIDITPIMALELMNACRAKGVDCIVAPYEADAQLAYLNMAGIAQVIITEDSDLILFGCEVVMYKMDVSGNGMVVEKAHINRAMDLPPDVYTFEKFRYMCILSGCDYLASLHGIGLGKANKLFKLTRQTDMQLVLKKMPTILKMNSLTVSSEYIKDFFRANNTFLYQLVYDPLQRKLVPLNSYPPEVSPEELEYAGPSISPGKAYQMAIGNIDLYTGNKMAYFDPNTFRPKSQTWDEVTQMKKPHLLSIWDTNYKPMGRSVPRRDIKDIHRPSTKGKEVMIKGPNLKKSTQVKRNQPMVENENSLTDADLLHAYSFDVEQKPPSPKRTKLESCENVLDSLTEEHQLTAVENSAKVSNVELIAPGGSTNRRKEAEAKTPPKAKENVESPPKSPLKSPRNKFALPGGHRRGKFNLNAVKESKVRSRYFKEEPQPLPKTNFFLQLSTEDPVDAKISQLENKLKQQEEEEQMKREQEEEDKLIPKGEDSREETQIERRKHSHNMLNTASKTGKSSPYGSFGFVKLTDFKSKFDKSDKAVGSLLRANNQFKPVMSGDQSSQETSEAGSSVGLEEQVGDHQNLPDINVYSIDTDSFNMSSQGDLSQRMSQNSVVSSGSSISAPSTPQSSQKSPLSSQKSTSNTGLTKSRSSSSVKKLPAGSGTGSSSKSSTILSMFQKASSKPQKNFIYPKSEPEEREPIKEDPPLPMLDHSVAEKTNMEPTPGATFRSPPANSKATLGEKLGSLGGCRQTGLSKNRTKSSTPNNSSPRITNFFTCYEFKKDKSKEKMAPMKNL